MVIGHTKAVTLAVKVGFAGYGAGWRGTAWCWTIGVAWRNNQPDILHVEGFSVSRPGQWGNAFLEEVTVHGGDKVMGSNYHNVFPYCATRRSYSGENWAAGCVWKLKLK
jgi:hypothetical protein